MKETFVINSKKLIDDLNNMDSRMISITVRTSDFRGDHSADIDVALNIPPNTTIGELVNIVFNGTDIRQFDKKTDVIQIRWCNGLCDV